MIEHYIKRSDELEDNCLAKFAAWYEFQTSKRFSKINPNVEEENSDHEDFSLVENPRIFPLKDKGYIRLRRIAKVIRFRRYNVVQDEVNLYREQLMLYVPWRVEIDSETVDYKCMYDSNLALIIENRSLFESRDQSSIDEAIDILEDMDPDDINYDGVGIEEILKNEGIDVVEDVDYMVDNPGDNNWKVDPNSVPLIKPPGGLFNVPNLNTDRSFYRSVET